MTEDQVPLGTLFVDLKTVAQEHGGLKQILDRILGVESLEESVAIGHVDDFISHLNRYFRCEERMMEMVNYPLHAVHVAEHQKILELSSNALVASVGHRIPIDAIAQNLKAVFHTHQERFDMVLTDYLRKKYSI
ncbi:MAG: hypothetical protein WCO00_16710 [Rhodospirillaceae bacterium]